MVFSLLPLFAGDESVFPDRPAESDFTQPNIPSPCVPLTRGTPHIYLFLRIGLAGRRFHEQLSHLKKKKKEEFCSLVRHALHSGLPTSGSCVLLNSRWK